MLPGNKVLITDPAGTIVDIVEAEAAGEDVQELKGILTPGFVNAHCHLELSHMKGIIPAGTGLVSFVQQVMTRRSASEVVKQEAMAQAEAELYCTGTVAVGDICNTTDTIAIKQKSRIRWHNFVEVSGFTDALAERRLQDAAKVLEQFQTSGFAVSTTLSPHAPYSVSKTLFRLLNEATQEQLITIHNQECRAEDELYKYKKGGFLELYQQFNIDSSAFEPTQQSSLPSWVLYFTGNQQILLVHNTFSSEDDLNAVIRQSGIYPYYCLCIRANQYIEQEIPPVEMLRGKNCTLVVGTDSYASNWQLNMIEELKAIQQATDGRIPLTELLQWSTRNGAAALKMESAIGSFEKGKMPGVVCINDVGADLQLTKASTAQRLL